jgi:hypothetical protein
MEIPSRKRHTERRIFGHVTDSRDCFDSQTHHADKGQRTKDKGQRDHRQQATIFHPEHNERLVHRKWLAPKLGAV